MEEEDVLLLPSCLLLEALLLFLLGATGSGFLYSSLDCLLLFEYPDDEDFLPSGFDEEDERC